MIINAETKTTEEQIEFVVDLMAYTTVAVTIQQLQRTLQNTPYEEAFTKEIPELFEHLKSGNPERAFDVCKMFSNMMSPHAPVQPN